MKLEIQVEREDDGRWIAEVPSLPGVLAYGATEIEAREKAQVLALRVLADNASAASARCARSKWSMALTLPGLGGRAGGVEPCKAGRVLRTRHAGTL